MQRQCLLVCVLLAILSPGAGAATAASAGPLNIQLDAEGLSAGVDDQPLDRVVAAINRLAPAGCALAGYVFATPGANVSVTFESLPLRAGLRRLLKGND